MGITEHLELQTLKKLTKKTLSDFSILVVDDSPHIQEFVAAVLGREGAHVVKCSSGLEALELCRTTMFDLILVDLRMPEMDGYQTLTHLRSQGVQAPVIAFSAGSEQLEFLQDSGFTYFMAKPVEHQALVEKISQLLH